MTVAGSRPRSWPVRLRRSRLVKPAIWVRKVSSADSRAWLRDCPSRSPGMLGAGGGGDRVGDLVEVLGSGERVVVESLDVEQASVGGEADLPQRGQITLDLCAR